jgi:hypothetical protein
MPCKCLRRHTNSSLSCRKRGNPGERRCKPQSKMQSASHYLREVVGTQDKDPHLSDAWGICKADHLHRIPPHSISAAIVSIVLCIHCQPLWPNMHACFRNRKALELELEPDPQKRLLEHICEVEAQVKSCHILSYAHPSVPLHVFHLFWKHFSEKVLWKDELTSALWLSRKQCTKVEVFNLPGKYTVANLHSHC